MDFRNIQSKKINAQANIRLKAKADLTTLRIDLERLIIDSIYCDGASCAFNQSFVDVIITFNKTIKKNDTFNTVIYYQGTPRKDPSGFGGFYFNNDYAYAIGVGFLADPHPFGRSWFPCFDNFVTKGTYSFNITTDTGFAALCGGTLDSSITNNAKTNWYYTLHQPTPSYLISLAVSRYELLEGKFNTTQGPIPYILAAQAQDTQNLKSSFINFGKAVDAFIHFYGPYNWDRLGYHVVPFNGGAMEHACNISYPLFAVNGNTSREDLMAHELAHSWWGNNITCRTQEDMWINEGWASYSEKLFNEFVYGKERYREKVEETHRNVLQFAHIADGEILPVSGIGHEHTYGRHVYRKGADIAHSLRFYMGDSSFFKAIKHIMTTKAYGNMDSKELIDSFQKFTSYDLSHFYKGWVIGKGFSHLSIKTWSTKEDGSGYMTNVGVLQRNRWNGTPHKIIPTEIYFLKPDFTTESFRIDATEFQSNFDFRTSYKPLAVGIDLHSKLNDATTDTFQFIDQKGNYVFHDGLMELQVTEVNEKAFVHVTHHWIGAETNTQTEQLPVLSRDRYWSVEGYFPDGFKAQGTIKYNGQTATTSGDNFLDNQLIRGTEDSLVLMFRPDAFSVWEIADATINTGVAKFDRRGSFTINNLQKGEYALAIYNQALLTGNAKNAEGLKIYPNPTKNHLHIEFKSFSQPGYILITDSTGKVILKKQIKHSQNNLDLLTQTWAAGTYKVLLSYPNGEDQSASFTVTK
jgi:aminopeptidase N